MIKIISEVDGYRMRSLSQLGFIDINKLLNIDLNFVATPNRALKMNSAK